MAARRGKTGRTIGQAMAAALFLAPIAAQAQTAPGADAIGDLLDAPPPPAAAPETPAAPPPATPATPPDTPRLTPPADSKPVYVDEVGRTPDGPPTAADRTYDARLRASFNSAQGLQGPLDGRWTLSAAGADLYTLQLVDKGGSDLEGAWRDVRRPGAVQASGFLADMARIGASLTFSFQPDPAGPALRASLTPTADGRWSGTLMGGASPRTVVMRRD